MAKDKEPKYKAYCVKCRQMVPIEDAKIKNMKGKRKAAQGYCPYCETKVTRFIKSNPDRRC